jgi:hypothetical protein
MRRVLASLAAVGVLVVLGACGTDTTPPKTWATRVCQALSPWRSRIAQLNSQAATQMKGATTPAQTRDNMLQLLDGARQSTETARARVVAAGVPDVQGGKVIANQFATGLIRVRDAYAKAHGTVQGLATANPGTFYDGVTTAISTLDKEYSQVTGLSTTEVPSSELRRDFDAVPECG